MRNAELRMLNRAVAVCGSPLFLIKKLQKRAKSFKKIEIWQVYVGNLFIFAL
uniref:Uncharacterized protein n=1 Tax=uncultured bacterium Rlip1 TaxID=581114 RepID=C0K063_9BACT|nr:unknown [uncultured bacterium Rlip1]